MIWARLSSNKKKNRQHGYLNETVSQDFLLQVCFHHTASPGLVRGIQGRYRRFSQSYLKQVKPPSVC